MENFIEKENCKYSKYYKYDTVNLLGCTWLKEIFSAQWCMVIRISAMIIISVMSLKTRGSSTIAHFVQ